MIITQTTYIDELQRNHIVSRLTRDICIDKSIFSVADLVKYVKPNGKIYINGMSARILQELQQAWDLLSVAPSPKPIEQRKLTRILSQEEKNTIADLQDLFESTFINSEEKKTGDYIKVDNDN